jgi:site-specific DNA-cytosine methylase
VVGKRIEDIMVENTERIFDHFIDDIGGGIRVLELFSGIGGMHTSLKTAGINIARIIAYDTSEVANTTYRHVFPKEIIRRVNIESLPLNELNDLADLWTM